MLISVKLNNCYIYNTDTEFTMRSDMRNKHFPNNVHHVNSTNVLKSAIIMGPNNVGKTNFVKCMNVMKCIMLNQKRRLEPNLFNQNPVCEFSVVFLMNGAEYCLEVQYDAKNEEYLYEKFSKFTYDQHINKKELIVLKRNVRKKEYLCNNFDGTENNDVIAAMKVTARNNLLVYLLDTSQFTVLAEVKDIIASFAARIDIVDMNNIPIKKTIDMLKLSDAKQKKIVNFILNADLYLEDFKYLSDDEVEVGIIPDTESLPQENSLRVSNNFLEQLHLCSTYKGICVPSIIYDSTGTKKIVCLASYVIDALENGRLLIVDELDNSLHFKLVRAIISMFNNELNESAQLICTVHDVTLLDCQKLFRKEQIWFAHKDMDNAYLYSLSEFTAERDGVRDTSDLIEKYKRGVFGALPEPDLFESLLEVHNNG